MDLQGFGFSNDDEYNFISERTGYSFELVEFILWQRYCYEMENDYWIYDRDKCSKCGSSELYLKEVPKEDFADRAICKRCGTEYIRNQGEDNKAWEKRKKSKKHKNNKVERWTEEQYLKGIYGMEFIAGFTEGGVPYGIFEDDLEMDMVDEYEKAQDYYDEMPFQKCGILINILTPLINKNVVKETDININVEIQLINQYNMIKRTVFYLSKMILSQLKKGEDYSALSRTITINILDFNYLEEDNFINNYLYHNKITKKILSDLCEIIFIELPKFNNTHKDYDDKLHKWLTFLANASGKEIQDMAKTDSEIKEAMDVLYNISSDEELRRLIDLRELAIMDEQNRLNGAKKEGKADLLIKQLIKKFKILPTEYRKKLEDMPEEVIEIIGVEIFDMESIEELKKYF